MLGSREAAESSGQSAAGSPSLDVRNRRRHLPRFLRHLKVVYRHIVKHKLIYLLLIILSAVSVLALLRLISFLRPTITLTSRAPSPGTALAFAFLLVYLLVYFYLHFTPRPVYLVEFACFRPPPELQISRAEFVDLAKRSGHFSLEAIAFQERVLENSGIGDESCMPRSVFRPGRQISLRDGREEAALVMFGAIDDLLAATGIAAREIKVLVVNCGVLNPTPSLSAMVINRYKLRRDVNSFNLGGMGCSAGVVAVDLAKDLLRAAAAASPTLGCYALVVSTEIVSSTWYPGSDLEMLEPNCFFRMGAAAVLLSSRRVDRWRSKYQLKQVVRTHKGMKERSFRSVEMREDHEGKIGLCVGRRQPTYRCSDDHHDQYYQLDCQKQQQRRQHHQFQELLEVGRRALKANKAALGRLALPVSEQVLFFGSMMLRPWCRPYIPDCKLAFEHVCVQAASRKALDEVQRTLGLTDDCLEASRKTLARFGNTSSSSMWYELAYLEAAGRVKRGERVWQVALGSGFKCNSMVWVALRRTPTCRPATTNPWI